MSRMVYLSIYAPAETRDALKAVAERRRVPTAVVIRKALDAYLNPKPLRVNDGAERKFVTKREGIVFGKRATGGR